MRSVSPAEKESFSQLKLNCRTGFWPRGAQVLELAFGGGQPAADFAQRVGLAELTKQHGHELAAAAELVQVAVGVMLTHSLLEFQVWKQLQKLGEDATKTLHG